MSSTVQGSLESGRGRVKKTDKTRRSWSGREEEILLESLKQLVAEGWKSDNGFRAGYLGKLEEYVRKEVPGTDLKGMPHIHSKISIWKKNYNSLLLMFGISGVGFDKKGKHMIDCTNDQWETIEKKDSNARLMRFKSWPMFDDWKLVFGMDRATGLQAEDIMDAVNDMHQADKIAMDNVAEGGYEIPLEEEAENENVDDSVCQSQKTELPAKVGGKKRKTDNGADILYELLVELSRNANKRLEDIASRTGYEFDLGKARKEIYKLLSEIPGLSMSDKFDVGEMLVDKVERLELFMGLPEDARPHYVMRVLQAKNP